MWLDEFRRDNPAVAVNQSKSWAQLTTLGLGAAHPAVIQPRDTAELAAALAWLHARQVPVLALGGGSNLIGTDQELALAVVRPPADAGVEYRDGVLHVGAGVRMPQAAQEAARFGLGGLAALAGIPGSIGGLVRMNAGANGVAIGALVRRVYGVRGDGSSFEAAGDAVEWGYRCTSIPADVVLCAVDLQLPEAEPYAELEAIAAEVTARRGREPKGRSAGCIFRNAGGDNPAGKLIDAAGLKGERVGGMMVALEHANYLINTGTATAADFVELVRRIGRKVREVSGLVLRCEVCFADAEMRRMALSYRPDFRVALFKGGNSSEREISLRSGAAVGTALRNAGYEVIEYDIPSCQLPEWLTHDMVVFPVLHGGFGEDGSLQHLLEAGSFRFVGSGSASCRLVMDKIATKRLLDQTGIPTAPWATVTRDQAEFPAGLHFPVVMKAPNEGSTIGIAKVSDPKDYPAALDELFGLAPELLIEEFIVGTEISVPVICGRALPVIEIQSPHGFYDYDAKYVYNQGHTQYHCPPVTLSEELQQLAQAYSVEFYHEAGCRDLLRVDFIIDTAGVPRMLEGNALPGCTATSLVPKAAKVNGISFECLCAELVNTAANRKAGSV